MTTRTKTRDPLELAIQNALMPGEYISDHDSECSDFVSDLEAIAQDTGWTSAEL